MKLLFLTLLYPRELREEAHRLSLDGLQNQADGFQQALLRGFAEQGAQVDVVNCMPVGAFPRPYPRLLLPHKRLNEHLLELGGINLPLCKQAMRFYRARRVLEIWYHQSNDHRDVLVYSLYLPYLRAVAAAKRQHPDLRAHLVVTDLPGGLGISSGRAGLVKRLEQRWGSRSLALSARFDTYTLLTHAMADVLPIGGKPFTIIEGIASTEEPAARPQNASEAVRGAIARKRPAVLYTGQLQREFQLDRLLKAFAHPDLADVELWLCGHGDMEADILTASREQGNVRYFGFVPRAEARLLQQHAAALINPRSPEGAFTQYSFPSKTLEYMLAGRPVLCCKLPGIPNDYDPYLRYVRECTADGFREAIVTLLALSPPKRDAIGQRCQAFAREHKNERTQATRLLALIRSVI